MIHEQDVMLPKNIEVEKTVLGTLLLNEQAYDEATEIGLVSADFFSDSHRRIFAVLSEMRENGQPVDLITLDCELDKRRQLESAGGSAYIASLIDGVPDSPSVKSYVKLIQDCSIRRRIIAASTATIAQASDGASTARECIENYGDLLLQIQSGIEESSNTRIAAFTDAGIATWNQRADSSELPGLTTGIKRLDELTTGICKGELWSIGGRTGDGKTALALQIAAANLRCGVPVLLFSLEMSRFAILERLWAHETIVPFSQIRDPRRLGPAERKNVTDAACRVGQRPLYVCDEATLSIQKLMAKARILIRREKIRLVIVDYVQLVSAFARDERERITKVSNGLLALAQTTGVPVIAVAQLTKPNKYNANERPNRFTFRETSAIGDNSHVCLFVYRPVHEEGEMIGHNTGEDEIIIDKQRNGVRDLVRVTFRGSKQQFVERENA